MLSLIVRSLIWNLYMREMLQESDDKLMEEIEDMYDFVDVDESPDESTQ